MPVVVPRSGGPLPAVQQRRAVRRLQRSSHPRPLRRSGRGRARAAVIDVSRGGFPILALIVPPAAVRRSPASSRSSSRSATCSCWSSRVTHDRLLTELDCSLADRLPCAQDPPLPRSGPSLSLPACPPTSPFCPCVSERVFERDYHLGAYFPSTHRSWFECCANRCTIHSLSQLLQSLPLST